MDSQKNDESPDQRVSGNPIEEFLTKRSATYRELSELRTEGWKSKEGDAHFARQRRTADEADEQGRQAFFHMMKKIGDEMSRQTKIFDLSGDDLKMLDLCMAPGGYTASCLKHGPSNTTVRAITLPKKNGGHVVMAPSSPRLEIHYTDITMLASSICPDEAFPPDHPDFDTLSLPPSPFMINLPTDFDLIFADGQVLRTHSRPTYRQKSEATRLITAQLIIALSRLKPGGSMVVLLHRLHAFNTVKLLFLFDQFAKVELFKPLRAHGSRSSFYMVARTIQPQHSVALEAVRGWREEWRDATMRYDEPDVLAPDLAEEMQSPNLQGDAEEFFGPQNEEAEYLMRDFGERLVELGEPVWEIQRNKLRKASFINGRGEEKTKEKGKEERSWRSTRPRGGGVGIGIGSPVFGTKMGCFGVQGK